MHTHDTDRSTASAEGCAWLRRQQWRHRDFQLRRAGWTAASEAPGTSRAATDQRQLLPVRQLRRPRLPRQDEPHRIRTVPQWSGFSGATPRLHQQPSPPQARTHIQPSPSLSPSNRSPLTPHREQAAPPPPAVPAAIARPADSSGPWRAGPRLDDMPSPPHPRPQRVRCGAATCRRGPRKPPWTA